MRFYLIRMVLLHSFSATQNAFGHLVYSVYTSFHHCRIASPSVSVVSAQNNVLSALYLLGSVFSLDIYCFIRLFAHCSSINVSPTANVFMCVLRWYEHTMSLSKCYVRLYTCVCRLNERNCTYTDVCAIGPLEMLRYFIRRHKCHWTGDRLSVVRFSCCPI